MTEQTEKFDSWCLIELFGHQRIAGRVTEATLAGGAFLRVDVPATSQSEAYTRFYGPGAIYGISPVTEEVARAMAEQIRSRPVQIYELPQLRAPQQSTHQRCQHLPGESCSRCEDDEGYEDDEP